MCVAVLLDVDEELGADHEAALLVGGHTQHLHSPGTRLQVCGEGGRNEGEVCGEGRREWEALVWLELKGGILKPSLSLLHSYLFPHRSPAPSLET